VDISVLATMKNAATGDTQCESQDSASHLIFERTRHLQVSLQVCPLESRQLIFDLLYYLSAKKTKSVLPREKKKGSKLNNTIEGQYFAQIKLEQADILLEFYKRDYRPLD
jgi:hypothetical protein